MNQSEQEITLRRNSRHHQRGVCSHHAGGCSQNDEPDQITLRHGGLSSGHGFISIYRHHLHLLTGGEARVLGKPVKLQIRRIGEDDGFTMDWRAVPVGKHVQGCLPGGGAYAAIESSVRVV